MILQIKRVSGKYQRQGVGCPKQPQKTQNEKSFLLKKKQLKSNE